MATKDALFGKMMSSVKEVIAHGAMVILVTDPPSARETSALAVNTLVIAQTPSLIQPLVAAVTIQLLGNDTVALRGTDVEQPCNLTNSLMVERFGSVRCL